ncbi:MAG: hypothetical protein WC285_01765 [Candidatus Gracilibacteria bacterium]|jgi:hypothetical protein
MKTSFFKKTIAVFIAVLVLSGCELNLKPNATSTDENFDSTKPMTAMGSYYANGDIEYYQTSIPLVTNDILSKEMRNRIMDGYTAGWAPQSIAGAEDITTYFHFYEVGTIKAVKHKGESLVVLEVKCYDMCMGPSIYRFAYDKTKNELTFLTRHSNDEVLSTVRFLTYTADKTTFFKGVDPPDTIKIPGSEKVLELNTRYADYASENITGENFLFADAEFGNVYNSSGKSVGCVYFQSPDGVTSSYAYNPHFFDSESVQITWIANAPETKNSKDLSETYTQLTNGCGIGGSCYLTQSVKEEELELAGKTSNGIDLYMAKNPIENMTISQKEGAITAQEILSQAYTGYKSGYEYNIDANKKPLMDFQTFVSINPIVYFKDPFGRWTGIARSEVQGPAECGKPVIYLYPEKETDVNVKVGIEKLTKTIPEYGKTGWTVKASPNGTLYNYADQKTYPYLFWEGQKDGGLSITKGFSVKRENLEKFLNTSLAKLGLTKQEKQDFTDFWLTRMLDNKEPYFFVSFVGTRDFNKVAPLEITPAPTTLIRVFMYYIPTYSEISMPAQELKSVNRNGFTVVEWGGTSSKQWRD